MKPGNHLSVFASRRARLAALMGEGVAFIATAPERVRNRDSHYPYRFDSYFYYLTGFIEPEAVLVVVAGKTPRSILFCRNRDPEREIWDGFRYGPEAARELFGFDEAHPVGELDAAAPRLLEDQNALYYPVGSEAEWDAHVMRWLNTVRARSRAGIAAPARLHDVRVLLDDMRLVKDEMEIAVMRRAARIAAAATVAQCSPRGPAAWNTRSRPSSCTNSAATARSSRRIRRSWRAERTRACCTMCRTMRRCAKGISS